jgi:hypothetical protein
LKKILALESPSQRAKLFLDFTRQRKKETKKKEKKEMKSLMKPGANVLVTIFGEKKLAFFVKKTMLS